MVIFLIGAVVVLLSSIWVMNVPSIYVPAIMFFDNDYMFYAAILFIYSIFYGVCFGIGYGIGALFKTQPNNVVSI